MQSLPHDVEKAIEDRAGSLAEILSRELDKFESADDCREYLDGMPHDDTLALNLDLHGKMEVLEFFAEDYGHELKGVTVENLRGKVEFLACVLIHAEACARVVDDLAGLEKLMDDEELDFGHAAPGHGYGYMVHRSEREIGDACTVLEYRNVEGRDVDLYVYRLHCAELPFVKVLTPDLKESHENRS